MIWNNLYLFIYLLTRYEVIWCSCHSRIRISVYKNRVRSTIVGLFMLYYLLFRCSLSLSPSALRNDFFDLNHDHYTERQPRRDAWPRAACSTACFNPNVLGIYFPIFVIWDGLLNCAPACFCWRKTVLHSCNTLFYLWWLCPRQQYVSKLLIT